MKTFIYATLLLLSGCLSLSSASLPQTKRSISIKLKKVLQLSNDGVGKDWSNFLSVQKNIIKEGETLELDLEKRAPLVIEAHAIEEDKSYSDAGKSTMNFSYSDLISIEKTSRFEMDVTVIEIGGQRAGSTAKWKFIFEISKEK